MRNRQLYRTVWFFFVALTVLIVCSPCVYAHPSSQSGILAKSYISGNGYNDYYVGGDDVGWSIDEDYHTNGTTLTYSFDTSDTFLTNDIKNVVRAGAAKWSPTVSIQEKGDGTGQGLIMTISYINTGATAQFTDYWGHADSNGHLLSWKIVLSRSKTQTAIAIAHEFGHAIGLNDLYATKSSNKLMYGHADRTATGPTVSDRWGAKVITGVHTTHTWGYKYAYTNSGGENVHVKYCTSCKGLTTITEPCTYNANNVCTKCGVPYGVQPSSVEDEID